MNKNRHATNIADLLDDFLSSRSAKTCACYKTDLASLAKHVSARDAATALRTLLASGEAKANSVCKGFIAAQLLSGLSQTTANRRLAAIRSFVRCARDAGIVDWRITVENITPPRRRTTPGAKWRP